MHCDSCTCECTDELMTIIMLTAKDLLIPLRKILGKRRDQRTVNARMIAMYRCRHLTTKSFPEIARAFGRDHSTVIHACEVVEKRLGVGALKVSLKPLEPQVLAS